MKNKVIILENESQYHQMMETQDTFLMYFTTPDCGVCKVLYPKLLELHKGFDYPLLKIDASTFTELSGQYLVFAVPTVLIIHDKKEVLRESRYIDFNKIDRLLNLLSD
ncbi:MAG: thioredoxin [Firmicutes bacterium HGW-Firmicutes-10]|jgi:thiol-disulfide isomerase/thioredoxin|nr:MAG: thioredoxin [Firmicutes bacterium HGW-Firmicutes-10]